MEIPNLLKSQTNEIYLALTEGKWNPSDFDWTHIASPEYAQASIRAAKLVHTPSKYYFLFDNYSKKFRSTLSPAKQTNVESYTAETFANQIGYFKTWLIYLKREYFAPNLWEEMPSDTKLIESVSADSENSAFTPSEQDFIKTGIEEIKQYLLTAHKLDHELIEGQLKYLVESSNRLGRKDWANIVVSGMFSIVLAAGVNSHAAQEIFQFVWTILSAVLIQKLYLPG